MPRRPRVPATPPQALPSGMGEIWLALRAEAVRLGRGALARRLGVSTHTLQRILVDGTVPRFESASVRQVRSWTRTLARLARHLGHDPRAWVEAAGIPWDDDAVRAAAPRARATPAPPRPLASGTTVFPITPPRLGAPGLSAVLLPLARQILRSVDPGTEPGLRPVSLTGALAALDSAGSHALPVAAGVLDCAALRARGCTVLALPGFRATVRPLCVSPSRMTPAVWADVPRAGAAFVVAAGDAAEAWLRVHRGAADADVHTLPDDADSIEAIIAAARACAAALPPATAAFLVADESTCRAVLHATGSADALAPDDDAPSFPIALAVPAGHPATPRLAAAWTDELFGTARAATASTYASILHATRHRLADFAAADDVFRRVLARELLHAFLRESGLSPHEAPPTADAWDGPLARTRALLPAAWSGAVESLAAAAGSPRTPAPHAYCLSCATSLHEHGGPNPLYCRHCADESGQLRPREEVHEILARWMLGWQDGLTPEAARARAARFMSTMPAWSVS